MTRTALLLSVALLFACRTKDEVDPSTIDVDEDGYTADVDCDDADPDVHPDAPELCDGYDQDCDEIIDEEPADGTSWYADADGDGWGDDTLTSVECELPAGFVSRAGDCDDSSALFHPGQLETDCTDPNDYNCDGSVGYADADGDGWAACEECDDSVAEVNPDAIEVCNDIDDDCDGDVDGDAVDATTWYQDGDTDGYGTTRFTLVQCDQPGGYVDNSDDCDDMHAASFPGGVEVCDEHDNDCDGDTDESDAVDAPTWFPDADGDSWGSVIGGTTQCDAPDTGWVTRSGDCDDAHAAASPVGTEICDELDNDCDGDTDEASAVGAPTWYVDADSDGYGDASTTQVACDQPSGYVSDDSDCDDSDGDTWPGADEYCDGADDDCDGDVDEDDAVDATTWYEDLDGDDCGSTRTTAACDQPSGYTDNSDDCDDLDAEAFPGNTEVCDTVDNDCDGTTDEDDAVDASTWYADADGDGYGDASSTDTACDQPSGYVANDDDCDDDDIKSSPLGVEVCDGADNDCNGTLDDDPVDADTWYLDSDGDGYGDPSDTEEDCTAPSGYVDNDEDCDDDDADINPAATETCDSVDEDCDGDVDDEAVDGDYSYLDADSDGYGDAGAALWGCSTPSGYADNDEDCDDADAAVNPGATELCNLIDDDCDGDVDADDDPELLGSAEDCPADDCLDVLTWRPTATDGTYWLYPAGTSTADQYTCDMSTDSGGWTLVFSDDMTSPDSGWSYTSTTTCGGYGTILGGYNKLAGTYVQNSIDLLGITHSEAWVLLEYVYIDSWDGETGYFNVDGTRWWTSGARYYYNGTNACGISSYMEQSSNLSLAGSHTASTLTLRVGSTLDQAANDESFGFDDVYVWVR